MKIKVKVHPGSRQEKIEKISQTNYEVWLWERAVDGKANHALAKFLKKEFGKSCKVVSGFNGIHKFVEFKD